MARKVFEDGTIIYRNENGRYHREDGPAVIYPDGEEQWYINGRYHREDGPAVIYSCGAEHWFINGKRHRECGPAIIYPSGLEYWHINGKNITEQVKDHVTNWRNWTEKDKLVFKLEFT